MACARAGWTILASASVVVWWAIQAWGANFALLTDRYMQEDGATRADLGRIAVAQRDNALR